MLASVYVFQVLSYQIGVQTPAAANTTLPFENDLTFVMTRTV